MIYFILLLELYIVLHLSLVVYLAQKNLTKKLSWLIFIRLKPKSSTKRNPSA